MSNETVTYSLEAVLTRIEGKIDKIDERLTKVEIGLTDLKGDIKVLDEKIEGMENRLISVEGTQKNQVWTLIILLGSAIITAGWKVFFPVISEFSNSQQDYS
ncbi:MAG: polyhydroxyalkanoate biosynthesis repressor PhaR [Microcystis flos-aquae TF09]|uniref:Polyhydroxyalkanoate biosynthesis repressor PhaR n=1 Tax=Microcystis flos-aquae TF09 TaxID=2060473 RepID=A0A3E0KUX2_9CHRO|nr:MAG: polyhydroxyalkanoate biosynthesis repressor PhaR [Microcystis flos-aquae TF09]